MLSPQIPLPDGILQVYSLEILRIGGIERH